ncbi:MAG: hypothetical protein HYX38_11770 [Rhodospirillales bacterium]|nr:hypothetical protein [Rhodospirillales bacterium]
MKEEGIDQTVALFHRSQGVACHRSRPKTRQGAHGEASAEVWHQPWVGAEYQPCFLYRTNSQFRALDELAQSRPDGVGYLTKAAELVTAHQPGATRDRTACIIDAGTLNPGR